MKIAIDVQTTLGQKTGFGFYVKNLVENIQKIDKTNKYTLIKPEAEHDLSTPARWWWDQVGFPQKARKSKVDILHQPCFSAPLFYRGKVVVTCHDLIAVFFPQNIPVASRLYFSKWMPFSYRRADEIIAISENTKKDIMSLLKIPTEKIRVIYEAAGPEFCLVKDKKLLAETCRKYKIDSPFILHVGTIEPRKNLEFLVRAYSAVAQNSRIKEKLVITGKKGWYYEGLFKLVEKLGLQNKVIFTGYVEDEDMPALYNAASLFTFPSLYEGFALPPLEAMACGTPVISSNTSSLPEVVGSAGILLPPKDISSWSASITEVLRFGSLRQELKQKSLRQAKKFSWEKTAQQTVDVYREVADE